MKRRLTALALALLALTASSEALAGLPIRVPVWHPPTPIRVAMPEAPADLALARARSAAGEYGPVAPDVRQRLDDLRDDTIANLDQGIERIARTERVRAALWKCAGNGLQSTADAVGEAMAGGQPDTTTTFLSAASGCVQGEIPGLSSSSDIDATTNYLLNLSAGYLNEVSDAAVQEATLDRDIAAAQRALAGHRWLERTAQAVSRRAVQGATVEGQRDDLPGTTPSDGSSVPPWLVAGALAVAVALVAARRRLP